MAFGDAIERSNPVFFVRIIRVGEAPRHLDVSTRVLSLTYEDTDKAANKLTMQVDNFDTSLFDDPQLAHGNKIEVSWGYPGNMVIGQICEIVSVKGGQVLTVEAHGEGIKLNQVTRVRAFTNMSREDVARQIATENGYGPELQDIAKPGEVFSQITQASMTDAQLLRDLANREGFEFWVDATGFHFRKRVFEQTPRRKFIWYVDPGQGDIMTYNIENDVVARPGAVVAKGINPRTKQPFSVTANNATTAGRPTLGAVISVPSPDNADEIIGESGALVKDPKGKVYAYRTTEPTEDAAMRQAAALYARSSATTVKLTMSCIGDPQLTAKCVIEVGGLGKRLSGLYYVQSVTHQVGSGYTMNVKAVRDATNAALRAADAQDRATDGKINKGKAPDDPSALAAIDVYDANGAFIGVQYKPASATRGAGS